MCDTADNPLKQVSGTDMPDYYQQLSVTAQTTEPIKNCHLLNTGELLQI